ncbi:MAG: SPOR domain-containing protein [Treponema sp.]
MKGEAIILPTTFWYLLPSNKTYYDEELPLPSLDSSSTKISVPIAYQIGFFKNKEYANSQAKKLSEKGYVVEIKEEKRESGTLYFAVFVIEKENGNTGARLKNEGYETFPIFE